MKSLRKRPSDETEQEIRTNDNPDLEKYPWNIAYMVGCVIFEFNDFENTINEILSLHIGGGDNKIYQHIFLAGMNFSQKVELLDRIYGHEITYLIKESEQTKINKERKELIAKLKEISAVRNSIVHANYFAVDKSGYVREKTKFSDGDAVEHWVLITSELLDETSDRLYELSEELDNFDSKFH